MKEKRPYFGVPEIKETVKVEEVKEEIKNILEKPSTKKKKD